MDPNWNDAVPSWRQPKTPQSASGKPRQWATVPRADEKSAPTTASSRTGSAMRSSLSTPGLATVGLGKFNIGALHEVNQQPDTNHALEECDDFFPGGLGIPDSFQGVWPIVLSHLTKELNWQSDHKVPSRDLTTESRVWRGSFFDFNNIYFQESQTTVL